jgi:hypothetical protein
MDHNTPGHLFFPGSMNWREKTTAAPGHAPPLFLALPAAPVPEPPDFLDNNFDSMYPIFEGLNNIYKLG